MRNRLVALAPIFACVAAASLTGVAVLGPSISAVARTQDVTLSVDSVDPVSPPRTRQNRPLTVTLTLTNHTDEPVRGIRIVAERGYPITTATQLADAQSSAATVQANDVPIEPVKPVTATVAPGGTTTVTFATTTSIQSDAGVCACANAVYPLLFTALHTGSNGVSASLDSVRTFLPLFRDTLPALRVGWVWPLLDRPHRLTSDTLFEDDDLATTVSEGGRLDRALAAVEQADPRIPLTLLLDPETIDELQVMSLGAYSVRNPEPTASTPTVPGTGQTAAADWLARLRDLLQQRPDDEVVLTPYADPDVQTLAARGHTWVTSLPAAMAQRVTAALGSQVRPRTDVAVPAAPRIGNRALAALTRSGVRNVVLDSTAVRTGASAATGPPGVVRLSAYDTSVTGLLTDAGITKLIAAAVTPAGGGVAALPRLLAQLAIRVTSTPMAGRVTVMTVPRYVDASVPDAVRTINATSTAAFATPTSLSALTAPGVAPTAGSALNTPTRPQAGLLDGVSSAVDAVRSAAPSITSLLTVDAATVKRETVTEAAASQATLNALPLALQRLQSSAWRTDSGIDASVADSFGATVKAYLDRLEQGVHIVRPSTGVYTLASKNSELPITVQNDLSFPVSVVLDVSTVNGVPGFSSKSLGPQVVAAGSKRTLRLQTTVQRSGRIQIQVDLSAPDSTQIGRSVTLTVHSTALGRIGVIITVVAGALLVLALLLRSLRWVRRRSARSSGAAPVTTTNLSGSGA